jgi:hypothetical protein
VNWNYLTLPLAWPIFDIRVPHKIKVKDKTRDLCKEEVRTKLSFQTSLGGREIFIYECCSQSQDKK